MLHADSSLRLDVRAILRTHDGALVYTTYCCIRHGPEDVMRRLDEEIVQASFHRSRSRR